MQDYLRAEGLDFHMSSLSSYKDDLHEVGFVSVCLQDRQEWYLSKAIKELNSLKNELNKEIIKVWENMIVVLESGEHRPGHFSATKPVVA